MMGQTQTDGGKVSTTNKTQTEIAWEALREHLQAHEAVTVWDLKRQANFDVNDWAARQVLNDAVEMGALSVEQTGRANWYFVEHEVFY
ncbi:MULTISPECIES: hypothetical protein [Halorussus]|uniref:hypothetical protein n=1 Tax=Halorussus TaxID=1070314 RepID=UPI0020A0C627|nr:hypothetical protein [Halorussus vallis]USZ74036.1 hypothetical protein NGM07_11270 [Halorussus vallis]